jgi:hypothetical protein
VSVATAVPLGRDPAAYHVGGVAAIEDLIVAQFREERAARETDGRYGRLSGLLLETEALLSAVREEIEGRRWRMEKLEQDALLGTGNFGAPAPGSNADERRARTKQALWSDREWLRLFNERRYFESRQELLRAVHGRLERELRRFDAG